jgi:HSP20 family protein
MERLHREVNRLFSDSFTQSGGRTAPTYPAMNVWTNEDGAVLTAELPGMNPDDLEISVVNETLTLSGNRVADEVPENVKYHRQERRSGQFTRTFQLPFTVEVEQVEAVFKNGVLHLSLPRAESEKPRKIAVKTA